MDLPLKASEAASLAELIFAHAEGKPLTDDMRNRLAGRAAGLQLSTIKPYFGSLAADPVHPSSYYLAVDGRDSQPLLLHIALASAPTSGVYPRALLIGRMRAAGREIVVNSIPFSSKDWDSVSKYAQQIDTAFLPRPQGARPAIAVGNRHPEISLPAAFEAFRTILKSTGVNMASTVQLSATREMTIDEAIAARDGENPTAAGHTRVSIRHLYHAGLWAAIRAGWREGYNAEADHFIVSGNTPEEIARSVEAAKVAIHHAAGYTKFTTDTSRLFILEADTRHPQAWDDAAVEDKFHELFSSEERTWILDEFSRRFVTGEYHYHLTDGEVRRLAIKFGQSLKLNEDLYDAIKKQTRSFDFEPSIDEAETLTTPAEMIFYMHWLKSRGRPAQLVPPNLGFKKRQAYPETAGALEKYAHHKMWPELLPRVLSEYEGNPLEELGARVRELAAVARHFQGTLSIHSGSGKQAEVLERIGKATGGRVNYKISGELQLQLFDVLSEQPAKSRWRMLFERMVDRTNEFAAKGAFGAESELAAQYTDKYLGDAERGRVDGNLFLVFWLGNIVGSRDVNSPDGDHRFFKEKLDELPPDMLTEVRRRNAKYIVWLAEHLRG
jgi:tagaturonate epimerase